MKRRTAAKRQFQRLAAVSHVVVEFTALRQEYFLHQCSMKPSPDTDSPTLPRQLAVWMPRAPITVYQWWRGKLTTCKSGSFLGHVFFSWKLPAICLSSTPELRNLKLRWFALYCLKSIRATSARRCYDVPTWPITTAESGNSPDCTSA